MSADLAILADDPSVLERAADPGEFLMLACERAKSWLAEALANGEIDRIAEMKAQAEAIRVYTVSKQLGKDAGLDAAVISGIGLLCQRFNGQVDDDTAIAQFAGIRNGVSGLMQQAAILGQQTGKQKTQCVAAAAVDSYNRGKRSKRLPSWWKATDS